MERILEGSYLPPPQVHRWMGRLHLHLLDQWNKTAAFLEISVRDDFLTVWLQSRTLSVMDRDKFRVWFWNPMGDFADGDLVWSVNGTRLVLSIDDGPPLSVPEVFVGHLASIL